MYKRFFLGFIFLVLLTLTSAQPILNKSLAGANSETYYSNYLNLTNNFFDSKFNVTQVFSNNLWIPWYTTSSSCNASDLNTQDFANPNMTLNSMVTDEFSEIGLLISQANNETRFEQFHNTVVALKSPYGQLPIWRATRNGTVIGKPVNDTASDASLRIALAYYFASNNSAFNVANRTKYLEMGNNLSRDHLIHEAWRANVGNIPFGRGNVTYWLSGGTEGIASQGNSSNPFVWTGYFRDGIVTMLTAYNRTGNITYLRVAEDYVTNYLLSVRYNSSTFKVAPFNYGWNFTSNPPMPTEANSYYWNSSNTQWDDSDAPRSLYTCHALRVANITLNGQLTSAFQNLSDYCLDWSQSASYDNDESCLQYYYNGTCSTSIRTGFYENGLGIGTSTYWNTSFVKTKVDETLTHYSWTTKTYDSAVCYGAYRGVRPAYSLSVAMGLGEEAFGYTSPSGNPIISFEQQNCSSNTGASIIIILVFCALAIVGLTFILILKFKEGELDIKVLIIVFIAIIVGLVLFTQIAQLTGEVCSSI